MTQLAKLDSCLAYFLLTVRLPLYNLYRRFSFPKTGTSYTAWCSISANSVHQIILSLFMIIVRCVRIRNAVSSVQSEMRKYCMAETANWTCNMGCGLAWIITWRERGKGGMMKHNWPLFQFLYLSSFLVCIYVIYLSLSWKWVCLWLCVHMMLNSWRAEWDGKPQAWFCFSSRSWHWRKRIISLPFGVRSEFARIGIKNSSITTPWHTQLCIGKICCNKGHPANWSLIGYRDSWGSRDETWYHTLLITILPLHLWTSHFSFFVHKLCAETASQS